MKSMVLAVALSLPLTILGQTVGNGNFQVLGSFDVSSGSWSKPMVAVASDPAGACNSAASMVVNTSTGSQKGDISVCINGAWMLASNNSTSSSMQFAPVYSGGSVTFGSCSTGSPCYLAPNNQLDTYMSSPTVTPGTGTAADTLFIYGVPGSSLIQIGKSSANTYGCSGCQVNSGISAPPSNSYAMYKCTVTGGQIVSGGCTPLSTPYANTGFENGLGTLPLVDTATGALQINNNRNPRAVTSGSDTITNLDCGGMVIYSEASTVNVALPQAGIGNPVTFASGCDIWLVNIGAGSVQITPNSSSPINGSTNTFTLAAGSASSPSGMYLVSNGTSFYTAFTGGSGGSSSLPLTGGTLTNPLTINTTTSASLNLNANGTPGLLEIANANSTQSQGIHFNAPGNTQRWFVGSSNPSAAAHPNVFEVNDTTTGNLGLMILPTTDMVQISQGQLQFGLQLTPSSSSAACSAGQMQVDATYIYVCTATNTWKRATLGTF